LLGLYLLGQPIFNLKSNLPAASMSEVRHIVIAITQPSNTFSANTSFGLFETKKICENLARMDFGLKVR
jgi:hypothetical protein